MMSSMNLLSSSSFFLSEYLTKQINNNSYSDAQFTFALKNHYIAALAVQEMNSDVGSDDWLKFNRELAKSQRNSALKLGNWYQQLTKKESKESLISTAIMWFEQAIRLDSQPAVVALAQLYYQQDNLIKAQTTLRQLPDSLDEKSLAETAQLLRINMAIHLGDLVLVRKLLNSDTFKAYANTNTYTKSKIHSLLDDIQKYAVIDNGEQLQNIAIVNLQLKPASSCITSLQLYATNLAHLKHIEQLISNFKEHQPLGQYVCLPIPRYISIKRLDCVAHEHQAISCDEALWQSEADRVDSRHIGLMLKEGGANVHLGILYFDSEDNTDVFSHEVSHLLGFVDEYPLIKNHDKCQEAQQQSFSHNIAVLKMRYHGKRQAVRARVLASIPWAKQIRTITPILQAFKESSKTKKSWRLGTPKEYKAQLGVFVAESCQQSSQLKGTRLMESFSAFKPVSKRTQLRSFSSPFPAEYIALLKDKSTAYLMPSFHYNIALALYQQGEVNHAKHWLNKASKWENDVSIKERILKGAF